MGLVLVSMVHGSWWYHWRTVVYINDGNGFNDDINGGT